MYSGIAWKPPLNRYNLFCVLCRYLEPQVKHPASASDDSSQSQGKERQAVRTEGKRRFSKIKGPRGTERLLDHDRTMSTPFLLQLTQQNS